MSIKNIRSGRLSIGRGVKSAFFRLIPFNVYLIFSVMAGHSGICCASDAFLEDNLGRIERDMADDGEYAKAAEKINSLKKNYPDDPRVLTDAGIASYGAMRYSDAYSLFKEALEENPEKDQRVFSRYAISTMDNNRETLSDMEKLAAEPRDDDAVTLSITDKLTDGHVKMLERITSEKHFYASFALAHVAWLKKNASGLAGLNAVSGRINYAAMSYAKAEEDLGRACGEDPENDELLRLLADCRVAIGKYDDAKDDYGKVIEMYKKNGKNPEKIKALSGIRRALPLRYSDISELIKNGRLEEAEMLCRNRLALNSGDYVAITQLGEVYWEKGDKRKAIGLFRKAGEIAPDYPYSHFSIGRAYFLEKKYEKGINEFIVFQRQMDLFPRTDKKTLESYVSGLHYIAYMYSVLGRDQDAIATCKKIIRLKPDDQAARYNLGIHYYKSLHDIPRAYGELKKAAEIDTDRNIANQAEYAIEWIRHNPDSRFAEDIGFIYKKE